MGDTLFNNVTVYGSADFCWIKGNIHLVLTFLAPVFCIVCVNIYFLSVAVWKIHIHSRDALITHKSRTASLKLYVKGLFGLLFLLGATWSVGILSVTYPSVTITYIFTILNSTQGFFIFIFNLIKLLYRIKLFKHRLNHGERILSARVALYNRGGPQGQDQVKPLYHILLLDITCIIDNISCLLIIYI